VAAGGNRFIEEHLTHARSGAFRLFPLALAVLAGVAGVVGVLAALVPAWISSRQDVVAALAGRRGITRSRRRWPILGAVLMAAGAVVAAVGTATVSGNRFNRDQDRTFTIIFGGLVLFEFGLVLATPVVVGLVARLGRWLPVAPRIAL